MKFMYGVVLAIVTSAAFLCGPAMGVTITPVLGDAQPFAVLGGSTVTNVPALGTSITGDLGVWSGSAVTGFAAGLGGVNPPGRIHAGEAVAQSLYVLLSPSGSDPGRRTTRPTMQAST